VKFADKNKERGCQISLIREIRSFLAHVGEGQSADAHNQFNSRNSKALKMNADAIISLIRLIRRHKIRNADAIISLIREIRSFPVRFVRVYTAKY